MSEIDQTAWGAPERHYAGPPTPGGAASQRRAPSRWESALQQVSPGISEAVERTVKQWNTVLRDYVRTETGLRLSVGDESLSVPIKVMNGMPERFANVMREFEELDWILLNRPAVEAAAYGTQFMEEKSGLVPPAWGTPAASASRDEIRRVHETARAWLQKLDELKALERIVGINEDVLGAYYFRVPEIRLYWVVIGITARAIGVSVDALTLVVLAHELAHAYTHLGRDIDNERWPTERFAAAHLDIVEGLAQFYTEVICLRLKARMPDATAAYEQLLEKQSGPYKAHRGWVEQSERGGEIVRVSMIECRSRGLIDPGIFAETIQRHREGVRGRKQKGKATL